MQNNKIKKIINMPKSQNINPKAVRKPQFIEFGKIPVNQYNKSIEAEKKNFSKDDFIRIFRDMVIIRGIETMLNLIKNTNEYNGIAYNHPPDLLISRSDRKLQQSEWPIIWVLMIIYLESHRSHGEILAKGLSAINQLDEEKPLYHYE